MKQCTITKEQRGELGILHLNGSLDASSFSQLETALTELHDQHLHRIVLNCEQLHFINSAALGTLVRFTRRVREKSGDLKLAAVSSTIRMILELLNFHKILDFVDDVETATTSFTD